MKLAVSFDARGTILTMFHPEAPQSELGSLRYRPAPRERHQVLEVPDGFKEKPLADLAQLLRVNVSGKRPKLEPKR